MQEADMTPSKPFWLQDPDPDQTSVRFCCPYCYDWIRNREFEDHMKLAHPQVYCQSPSSGTKTLNPRAKTTR
jgi:hypothetical protein